MKKYFNVKKIFVVPAISVLMFAGVLLASCTDEVSENAPASVEYGTLSVSASAIESSASGRAIYSSEIKSAIVTVRGYDSNGSAFSKTSGTVEVSGGTASGIKVSEIPACKNAVVSVQAYSDTGAASKINGITISAVTDITAGKSSSVSVNWESSKKGSVYAALLDASVNTNTLTSEQVSSINNAIPADTHAALIDASGIASAYKAGSLGTASSYKLAAGAVSVTCNDYDGALLQLSDPLSATAKASTASAVTIASAAPGTWTLYVLDSATGAIKARKSVVVTSGGTVDVTIGANTFDGIQIQVAKSLNYPLIHYWSCSNSAYANTKWPGIAMLTDWSDDDYIFNFENAESVGLLITKSDETKLCADVSITAKGAYRITASGAAASTYISDVPPEPTKPTVTINPVNGSKIAVNGSISVTFGDGNDTITSAKVTVNDTDYDMGTTAGTWSKSLSELGITTEGVTFTVSASVTNSAGYEGKASATLTTKEKTALVSNFNELRIFQVMVSHFQDGDSSRGYSEWYGPSGQNGKGDLQGIINALDYIADLGCNALWMTPIFNSSGKNGSTALDSTGYYAYDYFDIDPNFGTKDLFKTLVEKAHEKGINIILDGVVGHYSKSGAATSPNGKTPSRNRANDMYKGCDYPESLDFYKEVLSYWITEYKIDGWRLDQAYQAGARGTADGVYTGGTNYWPQLRAAVESAAASNGTVGTDWGTLGYMCGEVLDGNATNIQTWVVVNDGLRSCFDFPSRYQLCNAILGGSDWANSATSTTFATAMEYTNGTYSTKGYNHSKGYYPNLFLSNHDLLRFGDLIIDWKKYSYGSDNYVGKYKVALASVASYTGPITIYYGDEWGEATQGISLISSTSTSVGKGAYWDNSSRTTGHIDKATNGTAAEKEVLAFTKSLLAMRSDHEALWNGSVTKIISSGDLYAVKKVSGSDTVYVAINNGTSSATFSLPEGGTNLLTNASVSAGTVTVPALSAVFIGK